MHSLKFRKYLKYLYTKGLLIWLLFPHFEPILNDLICLWYNKSKYLTNLTSYNKISILIFFLLFKYNYSGILMNRFFFSYLKPCCH